MEVGRQNSQSPEADDNLDPLSTILFNLLLESDRRKKCSSAQD